MEDKINKIWYQMNMKEITSEEARQQVLDLFVVMQRSELLSQKSEHCVSISHEPCKYKGVCKICS